LCTIFGGTLEFRASFPRRCDDLSVIAIDVEDAALARSIRTALERAGHVVHGRDARDAPATAEIVVHGPTRDPAAAIASIRARGRIDVGVIVVATTETDLLAAHRAGALASLPLPLDVDALVCAVARAFAPPKEPIVADPLDARSPTMLGRLAASLSHELGTPLAALSMNLDVLVEEHRRLRRSEDLLMQMIDGAPVDPDARVHLAHAPREDVDETFGDARASVDRLRTLLARMKELADRTTRTLAPLELAPIVHEAARRAVDGDVTLEASLEGAGRAMTHGPTLSAIVTELVRNASHAARSLSSPRVRVEVTADRDETVIAVRDNGPGVEHDVREKIFDPFYTTKRGGLGLGLTVARDQAEQIGARIDLESTPGRGACIRVRLKRS
jgi:signal transduction histidine kinase